MPTLGLVFRFVEAKLLGHHFEVVLIQLLHSYQRVVGPNRLGDGLSRVPGDA